MTTFVEAAKKEKNSKAAVKTVTTNGMRARTTTSDNIVDLFYNIGASRGKNIIPAFAKASLDDLDLSLRVAAWARDVRGGAGERQLFRDILVHLESVNKEAAKALALKVPELGRWDDLLVFTTPDMKAFAYDMVYNALLSGDGLCAKWMPRKGAIAYELRKAMDMSPKQYRKTLVGLTTVVETAMCAGEWDAINFNHVPSLAAARYKKAFNKHTPAYAAYVASLVKGDVGVKVNAGAVYPYDILKGMNSYYNATYAGHVQAQWDALPNFVGDGNVLALVDVSGSMGSRAGGVGSKSDVTCLDVAISLGLYVADKNTGKFKDTFLTFSANPELQVLKGNIVEKYAAMSRSNWDMNTNLELAFEKILDIAVKGRVPESEMPKTLLILSDMQFDACVRGTDESALKMIKNRYRAAGYEVPGVVFWNLNASYGNAPVKFNKSGVALVSGFSPAIVKPLLSGDITNMTPEKMMMKVIMTDRYAVL